MMIRLSLALNSYTLWISCKPCYIAEMCVNVYYLDLRDQGIKNEHSIQRRTSALLSLQHLLIVTVVI